MKNIFIISIVGIIAISSAMVVKNTSDKMEQNKELQQIEEVVNNASVDEIILKSEKIYLPIDGEERLQYDIKTTGEIELNISYEIENEGICSIDENGIVHGLSKGTSNIIIHVNDKSVSAKVEVTDLIIPVPD